MLKVRIPPVWGLDGLKTRTDVISIFPWGWALLRSPPLARREYVGLAAGAVLVLAAVVVVSASDVTVVASEEVAAGVEDSRVVVTDASVVLEASVVSEAATVVEPSTNVVIDDSTVLVKSDVVATVVVPWGLHGLAKAASAMRLTAKRKILQCIVAHKR